MFTISLNLDPDKLKELEEKNDAKAKKPKAKKAGSASVRRSRRPSAKSDAGS